MIFKEMAVAEVEQVARLYLELANYLRQATGDEYFNFDDVSVKHLEDKLLTGMNKEQKKVFIAVDKGQVVGFIAGEVADCFLSISPVKKIGYIAGTYVISSYRKKGILTELENMMQKFFKGLGLKHMELHVLTKNITGKQSWERMGYVTFREQMRKSL